MEREQAVRLTQNLLRKMVERDGSDLFLTSGFPPAIKVDGTIHKATDTPLNPDQAAMMVRSIMNDKQIKEFDATKECNFAIAPKGIGRFRVSAFIQQGMAGDDPETDQISPATGLGGLDDRVGEQGPRRHGAERADRDDGQPGGEVHETFGRVITVLC